MIRQLTFDLPAQEAWQREDFFISPTNALALSTIDHWQNWPLRKLVLIGPEGSGKTHLAHLFSTAAGGQILSAADLADVHLPDLAVAGAVVVEDAEAVAGDRAREEALFHLHNLLATNGHLLITAKRPVRDWGIVLPDLKSRMEAAGVARLEAPDDQLLSAVLVKLFNDRQVMVPPTLIGWLVSRMERSLAAARSLVAALDAQALSEGKPITRAMAAALLDSDASE
ncbi:chromosomal replication initiator DnaA [Thioclava sp. FR2]|uniref:chromosomal replication initiator DnaA n=1 Tax=Thioclava sp. FR2 TaxID=3445780 RepID=UPI003EBFA2AB